MEKVSVKIFRYAPDVDSEPRYKIYEIPWKPAMKVLDALLYVQENIDPTLAFRYGCKSWRCGSCSILINGKPRAACKTEVKEGELILEPLPRLPIIRDLVADFSSLKQKMMAIVLPQFAVKFKPPEPLKIPAKKLDDLIPTTQCIECWSCTQACPVSTIAPADLPGPVFMVSFAQSIFNPVNEIDHLPTSVSQGLYNCTTCRACVEACPAELEIPDISIEKLRALAVQRDLGPLSGHLKPMHLIKATGKSVERITTPFLETLETETVEVGKPVDEVGFFVGCLADYRLQNVARAVVDILRQQKVKAIIPKRQVCCGSVLIRTGQLQPLAQLVQTNVNAFKQMEVKKVVTACAGCSLTLKRNYKPLVEEHLGIKELPFEVYHLSEYLMRNLRMTSNGMGEIRMSATFHDPCHLRRGQDIYREPRELLNLIPGVKFVEMKRPDLCCGAGGGVRAGSPNLTSKMRLERIKDLKEMNVDAIVTECPFCVIQLRDAVAEAKVETRVVYLEELISRSLS